MHSNGGRNHHTVGLGNGCAAAIISIAVGVDRTWPPPPCRCCCHTCDTVCAAAHHHKGSECNRTGRVAHVFQSHRLERVGRLRCSRGTAAMRHLTGFGWCPVVHTSTSRWCVYCSSCCAGRSWFGRAPWLRPCGWQQIAAVAGGAACPSHTHLQQAESDGWDPHHLECCPWSAARIAQLWLSLA